MKHHKNPYEDAEYDSVRKFYGLVKTELNRLKFKS
jgi:hypothetical protein